MGNGDPTKILKSDDQTKKEPSRGDMRVNIIITAENIKSNISKSKSI